MDLAPQGGGWWLHLLWGPGSGRPSVAAGGVGVRTGGPRLSQITDFCHSGPPPDALTPILRVSQIGGKKRWDTEANRKGEAKGHLAPAEPKQSLKGGVKVGYGDGPQAVWKEAKCTRQGLRFCPLP